MHHKTQSANPATQKYRISGHSMYPLFKDGQDVLLTQCVNTLKQGDVVVFEHPFRKQHSIKRIKHINPDGTLTVAGTASESEDAIGPISRTKIIGVVTSTLP